MTDRPCVLCTYPDEFVYRALLEQLMHGTLTLCLEHGRLWAAMDHVEQHGGTVAGELERLEREG